MTSQLELRFDGAAYVHDRDAPRLTDQLHRILGVIRDRQWHTLGEIEDRTGDPQASISAQLRNLRKFRFGSHTIDRRYVGNGLYEYRLGG